jgi:hypothetical protein
VDWKLEVIVVPVADVGRAKRFYSAKAGFVVDHDTQVSDNVRVVQLTPPGSACSISCGGRQVPGRPANAVENGLRWRTACRT